MFVNWSGTMLQKCWPIARPNAHRTFRAAEDLFGSTKLEGNATGTENVLRYALAKVSSILKAPRMSLSPLA